jgi:hypothetical protein
MKRNAIFLGLQQQRRLMYVQEVDGPKALRQQLVERVLLGGLAGVRREAEHQVVRAGQLRVQLSAVATWRCRHRQPQQRALAVPGCIRQQELLCVHRVIEGKVAELEVHPNVHIATGTKTHCPDMISRYWRACQRRRWRDQALEQLRCREVVPVQQLRCLLCWDHEAPRQDG